jgi:uncharacterized surface protein with fasciclin (FAS1) repeats
MTITAMTARSIIAVGALALAAPAFAQETPDLSGVSTAVGAAESLGLVETLASGEAYTAFIPSNEALEAVQGEQTDAVMADEAAFSTLIQGYVIPGNVMAADAIGMVETDGGTHTVDSLAGTPIELTVDGETLLVNGAPVETADLMLGNVTVHVLGAAFLPEAAAE